MSEVRPYVPAGIAVTIKPKKASEPKPKTRKLIAAEHKFKIVGEELEAARRRYSVAFRLAAEITWDTPLDESIKRKADEVSAEKAVKAALLAEKRVTRTLLAAGGTLPDETEGGK